MFANKSKIAKRWAHKYGTVENPKAGTPRGYRAGLGGQKIRSNGQGRGLGIGRGMGPRRKWRSTDTGRARV